MQIKTYSAHSIQYLILYKRALFKKKNGQIRIKQEWLKLLTQCKKKITEEVTKPDFVQLNGKDLPSEMKCFHVLVKEGEQDILDELKEVVNKMMTVHTKLQALISI